MGTKHAKLLGGGERSNNLVIVLDPLSVAILWSERIHPIDFQTTFVSTARETTPKMRWAEGKIYVLASAPPRLHHILLPTYGRP